MDAEQLDDPVLYRQELIKTHSRRLKALENRQALLGYSADVSIELEIAEIKEKIAVLGGEINELKVYTNTLNTMDEMIKQGLQRYVDHLQDSRKQYIQKLRDIYEMEGNVSDSYTETLIKFIDDLTGTLTELGYPPEE